MTKPNPKQTWVEDIEFILSECVRLNQLLTQTPKDQIREVFAHPDFGAHLPHPSGQGHMICGNDALRRIRALAAVALEKSDAAGTVEPDKVYELLKQIIVERFVTRQGAIDIPHIERAMAAAVKVARRVRFDAVHFIPCRLMYSKQPREFRVGPVLFRQHDLFEECMEPLYTGYASKGETPGHIELCKQLLLQARHYYQGFEWVAEVKVLNCDPVVSEERAYLAVSAAVDFLHLLFGAYYTDRMAVAGPRMPDDKRAHLSLGRDGSLEVSTSWAATSAMGFPDNWKAFLEREDIAMALAIVGKAIEPVVDPSIERPLGIRLADAASWFGQAARETSDAARVVKAVTALERLVMFDETENIQELVSSRGAAMAHGANMEGTLDELMGQLKAAYDLRSRLAHGSLSPFSPEVATQVAPTVLVVERAIRGGVSFFAEMGLLDRPPTRADIKRAFDLLTTAARHWDSVRAASAGAATSEVSAR